jgi:GT2 family glycosyltransferase
MNDTKPNLSLVIVHYNTPELLVACLHSIEKHGQGFFRRTLVIDSASDNGGLAVIRQQFPWVETIPLPDNRGFGRAANYALRLLEEESVLLLNADAELLPGAVKAMAAYLENHPEAGIVGPRQVDESGNPRPSCGGQPGLITEWARRQQHRLSTPKEVEIDPEAVRWVSGSAMLIRRDALRRAGLFDERYFLYFEDIDLCLRVGRAGYAVHYLPTATVVHRGGASTRMVPARAEYEYRRSQLRFWKKHGGRFARAAVRLWIALCYLGRLIGDRQNDEQARRVLGLVWRNDG